MRIAICDDNPQDCAALQAHLEDALHTMRVDGQIEVFHDAASLLSATENAGYSIYYLDIYLQDESGIALAAEIRRRNPDAMLVFCTISKEHMADGFEVGVLHYLLKPLNPQTVHESLRRCLKVLGTEKKYIEIVVDRVVRRLYLDDIRFIESRNKYCLLYDRNGQEHQTLMRLDDMEQQLNDARFLRCHRSFLLNMDAVLQYNNGGFAVSGGYMVPIKRGCRAEMVGQYEDHCIARERRRA